MGLLDQLATGAVYGSAVVKSFGCVFVFSFGLGVAEIRGKRGCHSGQRCCQLFAVRIATYIEREARVQTSIRRSSGTEQNSVEQMPQ